MLLVFAKRIHKLLFNLGKISFFFKFQIWSLSGAMFHRKFFRMFARLRLNSDLRNICHQQSVQLGRVYHNVYTSIIKIFLHLYLLGNKSPAFTIFQLALFLTNLLLVLFISTLHALLSSSYSDVSSYRSSIAVSPYILYVLVTVM